MMKLWKFVIVVPVVAISFTLLRLPGPADHRLLDFQTRVEFDSLPDFDFRSEAEKLWNAGEQEAAMLLLEQIVANEWPDKAAASQLLANYNETLQRSGSSLSRVKAFGSAFITGQVNSFEELAGASLADFFIYGDVRDLTRELVFEKDKSHFIISLSSLGLLTSLFPPADPLASLLKTSYKTNSLSKPMLEHIVKVLEPLKQGMAKVSVTSVKAIISELKPIWSLASSTKSWQQFALFIKQCKNTTQVKFITKVISFPGNADKLSLLLATLRNFPVRSSQMLAHIYKFGQKGMDSLYSVYKKGPQGIQFLLKNPAFYSRLTKNSAKGTALFAGFIDKSWSNLLSSYGAPINVLRYILAALLIFSLKPLLLKKKNKNSIDEVSGEKTKLHSRGLFWGLAILFVIVRSLTSFQSPHLSSLPTAEAPRAYFEGVNFPGILLFIIFSLIQLWSIQKAKNEIDDIQKASDNEKKIKLLENSEFYFDLPVYAGLAGTVSAFILLSYDPNGSRMLAYTTTVTGIVISIFVRGKWLFPVRKRVINGALDE